MKRVCSLGILAVSTAACFALAGVADASIEAYANLNVVGARLVLSGTNTTITGKFFGNPGVTDVVITGLLHSSSATATATGYPNVAEFGGPILSSAGMGVLVADTGAGDGLRGQNNFSNFNYTGNEPTAAGDTFGVGALVDLTGANPPEPVVGVTASTVAEAEVSSNPLSSQTGGSRSAIQAGASFSLIPTRNLAVDLIMNASVSLAATSIPVPPGSFASANTGWNITVKNPDGSEALRWVPDGQPGILPGSLGATDSLDPFSLSQNVAAGPGVSSIVNLILSQFKATVTLLAGVQYSFDINHTSQAQVITAGIPEPASCAVWALLVLTSSVVLGWRRR